MPPRTQAALCVPASWNSRPCAIPPLVPAGEFVMGIAQRGRRRISAQVVEAQWEWAARPTTVDVLRRRWPLRPLRQPGGFLAGPNGPRRFATLASADRDRQRRGHGHDERGPLSTQRRASATVLGNAASGTVHGVSALSSPFRGEMTPGRSQCRWYSKVVRGGFVVSDRPYPISETRFFAITSSRMVNVPHGATLGLSSGHSTVASLLPRHLRRSQRL